MKKDILPLKDIYIESFIESNIAHVQIFLEYFNNYTEALETKYKFPIINDMVFHKFEAIIGNKTLEGKIYEKEKSRKLYEENKQKGHTVAYSEIKEDASDIMEIQIGNFPSKEKLIIKYSFIQPIKIILNKFWEFSVPSTLTPRYNSNVDIQTREKNEVFFYKWNISVKINSNNNPLTFVDSPSHVVEISYLDKNKEEVIVSFKEKTVPNKDFTLLFRNEKVNEPQALLEVHPEFEDSYMAMIRFFPNFNDLTIEEAFSLIKKGNKKLEEKLKSNYVKSGKGEFFFVLDRSGSMEGDRIEQVKKAMKNFLEILPENAYFNVVSFGTSFEFMFPKSVIYNELNKKHAQNKVYFKK